MKPKKIKIKHEKKGDIELGELSKNELCRGVADMMQELQKAHIFIRNSGPIAKAWKDQRDYYLKLIRSKK
jgi:hypothetical protein